MEVFFKDGETADVNEYELWSLLPESTKTELAERQLFCILTESPMNMKRSLCRILGMANYYNDDALRESLEPIITAK